MAWISHEAAVLIEIGCLSLEFLGAFILAKEVWDRPSEVYEKDGLMRVVHLGVKVGGKPVDQKGMDVFFAVKSARKARWGFFFVAMGIGGKLLIKILSTFG